MARLPNGRYPPEDVDRGLMELILAGGDFTLASQRLKARGVNIPRNTLRDWKGRTYADRHAQLQTEHSHRVAERIAGEAEELAVQYANAEREALQLAREKMTQMRPHDLSTAARNFAVSKALQVDNVSSPLRGRPSAIVTYRQPQDILDSLARKLGVVDATAEEISEPQLATGATPQDHESAEN